MLVSDHMKICILLQNFDSYERIIALFNLDYFIKQFIHPTPLSFYIGILQDFACLLIILWKIAYHKNSFIRRFLECVFPFCTRICHQKCCTFNSFYILDWYASINFSCLIITIWKIAFHNGCFIIPFLRIC